MADQPTVGDEAPKGVATAVAPESNLLETTTVKDGGLPINVSAPTVVPTATDSASPTVSAPETPILVTESEVAPAPSNDSGLSEEVESLSGEIQALEAKIDRLTGSVKPVLESPAVDSPPDLSAGALSQPETPVKVTAAPSSNASVGGSETTARLTANEVAPSLTPTSNPTAATTAAPDSNKPESKTTGINDIYSKVGARQKETEAPAMPSGDEAEDVGSGSSIGTIGEVLAVFGVIIFMIMGAFPFYKSMMSESITEAIRSIGWPTAVVSLALGFLMSLFSHGKVMTKIFTVIILLLAAVLYLGVAGFQNYLGPLGPMLESVFSFYR